MLELPAVVDGTTQCVQIVEVVVRTTVDTVDDACVNVLPLDVKVFVIGHVVTVV